MDSFLFRKSSAGLDLLKGFSSMRNINGDLGKTIGLTKDRPNLLLTSAGRRSYMANYFRAAMKGVGKLFAINSSHPCPVFEFVDSFDISPLIYSEEYIPFLIEYCDVNHIGALIPLFDIDVPIIAKHFNEFIEIGCFPVVSDYKTCAICNDKYSMFQELNSVEVASPNTLCDYNECIEKIENDEMQFPLIVKPRWGMGSIGLYIVEDCKTLKYAYELAKREIQNTYLKYESNEDVEHPLIIQELIKGREYGVDIMCDLQGSLRGVSCREKISMRSGETDTAKTMPPPKQIFIIAEKIANNFNVRGNLDIDIIKNEEKYYVIDMNARFGGGYPFSHEAGVDLPTALVHWLKGDFGYSNNLSILENRVFQKDIELIPLDHFNGENDKEDY